MIKKTFFLIVTIYIYSGLIAQMHDNIWLLGHKSIASEPDWGGTTMDFSEFPIDIYKEDRFLSMERTNASICDETGDLLFYTNGIAIYNYQNQLIENGAGLNPGEFIEDWIDRGYPLPQGALILPLPNNNHQYILFHAALERIGPDNDAEVTRLYNTNIDMELNNGRGKVLTKNNIIIQDTLEVGKLTATKHANGRDWWIIVPEFDSNRYYRLLLTPDGVENLGLESTVHEVIAGLGQAVFSPDGRKYVRNNLIGGIGVADQLDIYDFDRCTGLLSNHRHLIYGDSASTGGVAISPNSRFLYVTHSSYVFQYDLEASNLEDAQDTIAVWDGFTIFDFFSTKFFLAQLASDNKIYIATPGNTKFLHVINHPDSAGTACGLIQRHIDLPTYSQSMPNFPNYRLGKLEDSPCDTIISSTTDLLADTQNIKLYPNPVTNVLNIEFPDKFTARVNIQVMDMYGRVILRTTRENYTPSIDINTTSLSNGIYVLKIQVPSGKTVSQPFVISK